MLIWKVTIKALCLYAEKIPECSPGLWHGITLKTAQKREFAILSNHRKNHFFSKSFCWGFFPVFNVFPPALKTRKYVDVINRLLADREGGWTRSSHLWDFTTSRSMGMGWNCYCSTFTHQKEKLNFLFVTFYSFCGWREIWVVLLFRFYGISWVLVVFFWASQYLKIPRSEIKTWDLAGMLHVMILKRFLPWAEYWLSKCKCWYCGIFLGVLFITLQSLKCLSNL